MLLLLCVHSVVSSVLLPVLCGLPWVLSLTWWKCGGGWGGRVVVGGGDDGSVVVGGGWKGGGGGRAHASLSKTSLHTISRL